MKRLVKCKHLLFVLKNAKSKLRNNIVSAADPDLIKAFCDCSMNILNGNVPVKRADLQRLRRYKKELRAMSCPQRKLALKRKLVIQRGGFLPTLLATILNSVVGAYLNK